MGVEASGGCAPARRVRVCATIAEDSDLLETGKSSIAGVGALIGVDVVVVTGRKSAGGDDERVTVAKCVVFPWGVCAWTLSG